MASDSERDLQKFREPPTRKEKIVQWIKDGVDLAPLIELEEIKDVDDVRLYLALSSNPACVDKPNGKGLTPLMIACRNGQKDIITLLLEAGADPNLTCTVSGSSSLYFACEGEGNLISKCREEPNYPQDKLCDIIEIVEALGSHGAVLKMNNDGLSPVCVAALNSFKDVVDYFASSSVISMPVGVKVKAYELLGVSQAVFGKHHTMDACKSFHLAASFHSSEDSHVTSDLDAWFVDLMNKENLSDTEVFEVKTNALSIAIKCLPDRALDDFWNDSINCAEDDLFNGKAIEKGYELFSALIKAEMKHKSLCGSIMQSMDDGTVTLYRDSPKLYMPYIPKLLEAYADAYRTSNAHPKDETIEHMGNMVFNIAYYLSESKYLVESLPFVGHIVNMKRKDMSVNGGDKQKSIVSVFFERMAEAMWEDVYSGQSKQTRNRLKFTICRLLHYNGLDLELDKSLLETLLEVAPVARDMDFILSVSQVLIRYGCPTKDTYLGEIDEDDQELSELLEPTTPILLEELAARAILRNRVPYRDRLPDVLCEKIEGEKLTPDPFDLDSSTESDDD